MHKRTLCAEKKIKNWAEGGGDSYKKNNNIYASLSQKSSIRARFYIILKIFAGCQTDCTENID